LHVAEVIRFLSLTSPVELLLYSVNALASSG